MEIAYKNLKFVKEYFYQFVIMRFLFEISFTKCCPILKLIIAKNKKLLCAIINIQ